MNKKYFILTFIFLVLISITLILASTFQTLTVVSPTSGSNVSGTITLNASTNTTGISNDALVNATFSFIDTSGSTVLTSIVFNNSVNDASLENLTFDTNLLTDGQYNISVLGYNSTGSNITNTSIVNVTVDNTVPIVTNTAPSNQVFNITSGNQTFSARVTDALTNVQQVIFMFDNASTNVYAPGNIFNITATNNSGTWNFSQNVSGLQPGSHVVTVFAQDYAGAVNQNTTISFTVNTPPNVTINSANNQYYTSSSASQLFNVTAINRTAQSRGSINYVVFQFDNASGNDFNVTQTLAQASLGKYYNFTYPVGNLTEGVNTVTLFVNDTLGNINQTQVITFYVDDTVPTVSVTCSPSSVTAGQSVVCTCASEDTISGINSSSFGTGLTSETITTSGSGTKASSICTATDNSGNSNTGTGSYSVSSSGGSGSGGSGSGFTTNVANAYQQKTWNSVYKDETAEFELKNTESGITSLAIPVKETVYGAWIRVTKKDNFPSSVEEFKLPLYRRMEITTSNTLEDSSFDKAELNFEVENSWFGDNKASKQNIALYRFANGKWQQLETQLVSENNNAVQYKALTPGFSYFVIGVTQTEIATTTSPTKEAESTEEVAVEETEAPEEVIEETATGSSRNVGLFVSAIILLAIFVFIYWYYTKNKKRR